MRLFSINSYIVTKVRVEECDCEIYSMVSDGFITHKNTVVEQFGKNKIDALYTALVEFIKWYNTNKQ